MNTQAQIAAAEKGPKVFTAANVWLEDQPAEARIAWALENLPKAHVLSSSFGIQSAVMLHMMTRAWPDVPVLVFDSG